MNFACNLHRAFARKVDFHLDCFPCIQHCFYFVTFVTYNRLVKLKKLEIIVKVKSAVSGERTSENVPGSVRIIGAQECYLRFTTAII